MGIRRTISILTDSPSATPAEERERVATESDVITTAAAIGFSASLVQQGGYELAGVGRPPGGNSQPSGLTPKGRELWEKIRRGQVPQYTPVGAYAGFVDDHNAEGDTDPVGPMPAVRFLVTDLGDADPLPEDRWLPPDRSGLWQPLQ